MRGPGHVRYDGPMKVLAIDDDATCCELLELRLRALGCELVVAHTAAEGLRAARAERPDFVMLDLKLDAGLRGDTDGGERLFADLRADAATAHLPVVLHSVFVAKTVEAPVALREGDALLRKPFRYEDLARVVEGQRAHRAARPPAGPRATAD